MSPLTRVGKIGILIQSYHERKTLAESSLIVYNPFAQPYRLVFGYYHMPADLDIIIPVKNESKTISTLVERLCRSLNDAHITFQLLCIDDHSTDTTLELLQKLSFSYPIKFRIKQGQVGKAWSILEGIKLSTSANIAIIDADLQYPPEVIPQMFKLLARHGVVVANRRVYQSTLFRRFASRLNAFVFGRLFFGLTTDVQSGLKLFKREIVDHLDVAHISAWSLDVPLLYTARELGYTQGEVDIIFDLRRSGQSKINFISAAWQIVSTSVKLKLHPKKTYPLAPYDSTSMLGAGVVGRRQRFITHSTLPDFHSAFRTLTLPQAFLLAFLLGLLIGGLILNLKITLIVVIALLSAVYFIDVVFNLAVTLKSLQKPPEISVSPLEIERLKSKILPVYSILCPLYREARVLPQFLNALDRLDWPKSKLDVILLLEVDDAETLAEIKRTALPDYVRALIVPNTLPKTKPKALNYGLAKAKGKYVVVYDAEDIPDPLQLKTAYLTFGKVDPSVVCLQAKLKFYNPHQNLLTRLFTAEYSLWFEVILPGLQSINTTIPLGGTSNHFRTEILPQLHGWDAFNVTEDCDLGVRLFKYGYKTAIINTTTAEEANSSLLNWLRQRSRWIKGYLQTYLVHMRSPIQLIKTHGMHAFVFQLIVGMRVSFMLINPLLWLMTFAYFVFNSQFGPTIKALYPTPVFYMGVISLIFGNFLYLYNYMVGAAKREHWTVIKFVFLVPFYWLGVSLAAVIAAFELITNPHYWAKTHHGLHLMKSAETITSPVSTKRFLPARLAGLSSATFTRGGLLILATLLANFFNFLYNAYLGRHISLNEFGLVSVIGSLLTLVGVPFSALSRTITYRSAYLLGKYNTPVKDFWLKLRHQTVKISLILSGLWLFIIPITANFFHTPTLLPFILFTPVWFAGFTAAVDSGYIGGSLKFGLAAFLLIAEAVTKFILTFVLVQLGLTPWVYVAIPASMMIVLFLGWWGAVSIKTKQTQIQPIVTSYFPRHFFLTSILTKISAAAFLSFDVILAKRFLSPTLAGQYALLSLGGKMVFFFGSLFSQFILPLVSREEGAEKDSRHIFESLLVTTAAASAVAYFGIGLLGTITLPLLFGTQAVPVVSFLPVYALAIFYFTLAQAFVTYHQAKKHYLFTWVSFAFALFEVGGIFLYHRNISEITYVLLVVSIINLVALALLHFTYPFVVSLGRNIGDFFDLFRREKIDARAYPQALRILIFNWRDTKHKWSGGAEVYLQELAKRWVQEGHAVTVFCGNDESHPRGESIEGVNVVRRGGFYMVYVWAFLYYLVKFRGIYDVVIDVENGVPFFTPLYVRVPKFLLIHHVHQNVFREHLRFPLSQVALFVESKLMPLVYRHQKIITISESSKTEIIKLGLGDDENIEVVHPGVENSFFTRLPKTIYPLGLYLGRLKFYKNIDIAIKAFADVIKSHPKAKLAIAGEGEAILYLKDLTYKLGIAGAVDFLGRVSEAEKRRLLAISWYVIQPSSYEGWGLTVIEANASGTPVVAANVSGLKDSVVDSKTGILVPVKNSSAMTIAINQLVGSLKLRKKLSQEAYDWSGNFTWEKSALRFRQVITRELSNRQRFPYLGKVAVARD